MLLIKGKNGYVYHPNLPCNKYSSSNAFVSKLTLRCSNRREYKIVKTIGLTQIDPECSYFLYPIHCGEIQSLDKIEPKFLQKLSTKSLKTLNKLCYNVIIKYGGINFATYRRTYGLHEPFYSLVNKYLEIAKCILILNTNNIIHRDIHDSNIVIDNNGKIRLIDFELLTNIYDMTDEIHQSCISNKTLHWSLDYKTLLINRAKILKDASGFDINKFMDIKNNVNNDKLISFLNTIDNTEESLQKAEYISIHKLDIYSFGKFMLNDIMIYETYNISQLKNIRIIKDIINKCICDDPIERITIYKLCNHLITILCKFQSNNKHLYDTIKSLRTPCNIKKPSKKNKIQENEQNITLSLSEEETINESIDTGTDTGTDKKFEKETI